VTLETFNTAGNSASLGVLPEPPACVWMIMNIGVLGMSYPCGGEAAIVGLGKLERCSCRSPMTFQGLNSGDQTETLLAMGSAPVLDDLSVSDP